MLVYRIDRGCKAQIAAAKRASPSRRADRPYDTPDRPLVTIALHILISCGQEPATSDGRVFESSRVFPRWLRSDHARSADAPVSGAWKIVMS